MGKAVVMRAGCPGRWRSDAAEGERCLWFLDEPLACCYWLYKHKNHMGTTWEWEANIWLGAFWQIHTQSLSLGSLSDTGTRAEDLCVCVFLNPNITLFFLPLSCPHTCPIPICFLPVLLIYYLIKKIQQEGHILYALSAYSMYYLEGDVTSASSLGGPVTCFTGSLINFPSFQ